MNKAEPSYDHLFEENAMRGQQIAELEAEGHKHQQTPQEVPFGQKDYRLLVEHSIQGLYIHQDGIIQIANPALAHLFGYTSPSELIGQPFEILVAPHERARLEGYRVARLRGQAAPHRYEYQGIRRDGTLLWIECMVSRIPWQGAAAILTTFADVTSRKQAEESLQRHADRLRTLTSLNQLISSSLDMQDVLNEIAQAAAVLTEATLATFWFADDITRTLTVGAYSVIGMGADFPLTKLRFEQGAVGWVATHRRTLNIANVFKDARMVALDWWRAHQLRGFLGIPVLLGDRLLAVLSLSSRQSFSCEAEDILLLESFVAQAALAIHNAQLFQDTQTQAEALARANAALQEEIRERQQAADALSRAQQALEQQVSERTAQLRKVNTQLQTSEKRYRQLVENSIQGVSVSCRNGQCIFANAACAYIFGYKRPDDLIGINLKDLVAPVDRERLAEYRRARLRGEPAPERYEYQGITRDGRPVWLERSVSMINWGGEQALLHLTVDITERKHLEDQLRQAQKMEAIGTLAGGIAHDFNNILAASIGYTELALDDVPQDSPARKYLQEVLTAGTRAKALVQQILTFSRQGEQERRPIKLQSIINEVMGFLRASLPTTIELRQQIASDVDAVLADPTQMQQVLMNLCTNAGHAMRETGGTLEICLDMVDLDNAFVASYTTLLAGQHVRLTVRDTGHGMSPEVLERLFDPFFTTKGVGEGTGMGLAVVHGIITDHQGAITVRSMVGEGTTFTLYLPCIPQEHALPETKSPEPLPLHGTGRILFVDDEATLVDLGRRMLERLGYAVTVRTSSLEALEAFRAMPEQFDLVITDQTMPNLTGEGLSRELRRIRPDIPIILCTGFSHTMYAEKAKALGINAFCMKPLAMRDLAVTIQQVLAVHAGQVAPAGARILLIDDDDQLRHMLRQQLESTGYEVGEACDGQEGIKRYRETPTDLIITDLIMPEKEGLETIMELRREFPEVKIIAMSGGMKQTTQDFLSVARKLGAQQVLHKPFAQDELLQAIQQVLGT